MHHVMCDYEIASLIQALPDLLRSCEYLPNALTRYIGEFEGEAINNYVRSFLCFIATMPY